MGRRVVTMKNTSMLKAVGAPTAIQYPTDNYMAKLFKFIPAEIVVAFVTIDGIIRSITQISTWFYWIIFFLLLILTPLYIWRVTTESNKPPAVMQIIISTIAFIIWVFTLGGPFHYLSWYQPIYGAVLLPIYTLIIPIVVGK